MKRLFLVCALGMLGILGPCSLALRPAANPVVVAAATPIPDPQNLETAIFAGGCFWSMQRMLDIDQFYFYRNKEG